MPLLQLIYTSRPFGFDEGTLDDILVSARRHNARNGLTGALICRADLYMQMLEGSREAVTATFRRILQDDRHLEVALIWAGAAKARLFPDWAMRDDPPRSWMWTQAEVAAGAAARATPEDVRGIFSRLAATPPETRPAAG
ncbi:MAG: BLUF domain-containing protein [Proteobacteria bacterium]|nr:BLUF domain-containing protein [Pseudomonadota bacterium]